MRFVVEARCAGAALLVGCLPGDTRPPPGNAVTTAEPSDAVANGVTTADGWAIEFERFLAGLGNLSLHGTDCIQYSGARYSRIYDFAVGGQEKLGEVFGLGRCSIWVHLRPPGSDALLMSGTTASDVELMRKAGFDDFYVAFDDWDGEGQRVSAFVRGSASRGTVTKRFEWTFRQRLSLHECPPGPEGGDGNILDLRADEEIGVRVVARGEELFRSSPDDEAELRFDAFAEADADGDGSITLDEMTGVTFLGAEAIVDAPSLAHFVYQTQLPRVVRLNGSGACEAEVRRGRD